MRRLAPRVGVYAEPGGDEQLLRGASAALLEDGYMTEWVTGIDLVARGVGGRRILMGGIPGDVPLGVLEGEVPGGRYLLQAANDVPEAGINAGEWVVASQIAPTGP